MFRANKLYYDYYSNAYYVTYDELRKCCPESEVEIFDDPPKISEAPPFIQGELIPPAGDSTNYNHHNNFGAHHNHHQSCRKKTSFLRENQRQTSPHRWRLLPNEPGQGQRSIKVEETTSDVQNRTRRKTIELINHPPPPTWVGNDVFLYILYISS